jgi:hypothetical protein
VFRPSVIEELATENTEGTEGTEGTEEKGRESDRIKTSLSVCSVTSVATAFLNSESDGAPGSLPRTDQRREGFR